MQNCRNNNPYMRRANCGCGNNNNRLYHLAVEEPEALQRCKQQGNDDSLKSKTV